MSKNGDTYSNNSNLSLFPITWNFLTAGIIKTEANERLMGNVSINFISFDK